MMDRKEEEWIKDSLTKGIDTSSSRKEEIWQSMQNQLDEIDRMKKDVYNKNTKKNRIERKRGARNVYNWKRWTGLTVAATLFFALLLTTTSQGQAVISQIRMLFEPEKKIEQELEGMPEDTDMKLHEGERKTEQEASFVIYVDEERYDVVKEEGVFRITVDLPERYPEVYMEIIEQKNVKTKEAMEEIRKDIVQDYENVGEVEQVESPVIGYRFSANNGYEWDDPVVVYYAVSNELDGSFIIKQKYFMEASEGHGVRMDNMLKEFHVVIKEDPQTSN
ncbi:hypothetical protein [Halalkalibacter urbisdiaboli]|uniref:hypothetical protein n=1 Tax=Halalkalibacter urbisdiaboli TaxID=1960589 RepID=UPI000B4313B6|nr:hypothetical protein [Halalkalibacter urbisdiaboli]